MMLMNAQADMEVIGEAADGNEGIRKTIELQPDVVLMDLSMPHGKDGFAASEDYGEATIDHSFTISEIRD